MRRVRTAMGSTLCAHLRFKFPYVLGPDNKRPEEDIHNRLGDSLTPYAVNIESCFLALMNELPISEESSERSSRAPASRRKMQLGDFQFVFFACFGPDSDNVAV